MFCCILVSNTIFLFIIGVPRICNMFYLNSSVNSFFLIYSINLSTDVTRLNFNISLIRRIKTHLYNDIYL